MKGGSSKPVNNNNRKEYVDLYTKWVLEDSIQRHFIAFSEGFHEVRTLRPPSPPIGSLAILREPTLLRVLCRCAEVPPYGCLGTRSLSCSSVASPTSTSR